MRRVIANDSIARCSALAPAPLHPGSSVWGRVVTDVQRRRQHPFDIRLWRVLNEADVCATMCLLHVLILSHFIVTITASVTVWHGRTSSPANGSTDNTQTTGSEVAAAPQAVANSARSCGSSF